MATIVELKQKRKELKITFDELAEKSGLPKRTLENIFHGITKNPRVDTMQAIEKALGIEEQKSPPIELSEGEKALIELFNRVPADKQDLVLQMIRVALETQ